MQVGSFEYVAALIMWSYNHNAISVCVYRPPNFDPNVFCVELDIVLSELRNHNDIPIIVGSDFNIELRIKTDCSSQFLSVMSC